MLTEMKKYRVFYWHENLKYALDFWSDAQTSDEKYNSALNEIGKIIDGVKIVLMRLIFLK
jgi:hypothetical protein